MCLATPMKVIKIKGTKAEVSSGDHQHMVDTSLLSGVKVGDYLLAHADLAIQKMSQKEAQEVSGLIKDFGSHH